MKYSVLLEQVKDPAIVPVRDLLSKLNLTPKGNANGQGWFVVEPCPIVGHAHEGRGFRVNENGAWFCFACNEGGDVVHLVSYAKFGHRNAFRESVEWIADAFGLARPDFSPEQVAAYKRNQEEKKRIYSALEAAADFFNSNLNEGLYTLLHRKYGLTRDFVDAYKIGYAPGKGLKKYLADRDIDYNDMVKAGLFYPDGQQPEFFRRRIVFPYWTHRLWIPPRQQEDGSMKKGNGQGGSVVYMTGRALTDQDRISFNLSQELIAPPKQQQIKYKKLPVYGERTRHISRSIKNDWLVGEDPTFHGREDVSESLFITEGTPDPLPLIQSRLNAVSITAKSLSDEAFARLVRICQRYENVYLVPDCEPSGEGMKAMMDLAGRLAAQKINPLILSLTNGAPAEQKIDPASFFAGHSSPEEGRAHFLDLARNARFAATLLIEKIQPGTSSHNLIKEVKKLEPYLTDRTHFEIAYFYDAMVEYLDLKGTRARELKKMLFSHATSEDQQGNPTEDQMRKWFSRDNDDWRYDPTAGVWHHFNKKYWEVCRGSEIQRELMAYADEIQDNGKPRVPNGYSARYIDGIHKQLKWKHDHTDWNTNRCLVPFENGVADLSRFVDGVSPKDLRLRGHNKEDCLTWQLPYAFDPDAKCPTIDKFLEEVTSWQDEDGSIHLRPEAVDILMCFMAATLRGMGESLQMFLEVVGPGGSGKGTFCSLVSDLIGPNNTFQTTLDGLETDKFNVSGIIGKKMMLISDSEAYTRKAENFRMITGGDPVPIRLMRENPIGNYQPHVMTLVASNEPVCPKDPHGALERRRLTVPFSREISKENMVGDLKLRMRYELPGLVNKLLQIPESHIWWRLKNQAESLRMVREDLFTTDPIGAFVRDMLVVAPCQELQMGGLKAVSYVDTEGEYTYEHSDTHLYPAYMEHFARNNPNINAAVSSNRMTERLRTLLYTKLKISKQDIWSKRTNKGRCFYGIGIRNGENDHRQSVFDLSPVTGVPPKPPKPSGPPGGGGSPLTFTDGVFPSGRYESLAQWITRTDAEKAGVIPEAPKPVERTPYEKPEVPVTREAVDPMASIMQTMADAGYGAPQAVESTESAQDADAPKEVIEESSASEEEEEFIESLAVREVATLWNVLAQCSDEQLRAEVKQAILGLIEKHTVSYWGQDYKVPEDDFNYQFMDYPDSDEDPWNTKENLDECWELTESFEKGLRERYFAFYRKVYETAR